MVTALEAAGATVACFSARNNIQLMLRGEKVIRYIRINSFQLIHCHLPWAGFLGRYIHWRTGIPVVYTEHNKQERYHWITAALNKVSFNLQSCVVTVSNAVSMSIFQNIHPKIPLICIRNGVDTDHFRRDPKSGAAIRSRYLIPHDAVVIGIVAVFRSQKRLKEWLQVFYSTAQKHPGLFGFIVGAGPLEPEVKDECRRLSLEQRVILPGLQSDTRDFYSAIDIFMMTSSFEGLPVALLEAMSMECAVVSTDAGGINEIIDDGHTGFLVPVNEWRRLNECLGKMLDPQIRYTMAKQARTRVEEEFTIQKMVFQLEEVYINVLKSE